MQKNICYLKNGDNILGNRLLKDGELANVRQNSYPKLGVPSPVTFKEGTQKIELSIDKIGTFAARSFWRRPSDESENNIRIVKIELIYKTQ